MKQNQKRFFMKPPWTFCIACRWSCYVSQIREWLGHDLQIRTVWGWVFLGNTFSLLYHKISKAYATGKKLFDYYKLR